MVTRPKMPPTKPHNAPTTAEAGFPGFDEYTTGVGIAGPAGIPAPVVAKLNEAIRASLAKPETLQRLRQLGAIAAPSSPDEFRTWLQRDRERWERVIKAAKVTAE